MDAPAPPTRPNSPVPRAPASKSREAVLSLAENGNLLSPGRATGLAARALMDISFPDPALASAAEILAQNADGSPIWPLIAVTAAEPDTYDDATIDATVVAFCEQELDESVFNVALSVMEHLGRAAGWEPLDHARWVVRLAMSPSGPGNAPLVVALLRGIRQRSDAIQFMSDLLTPMLDLAPDHPGPLLLVEGLEDSGWQGEALQQVIERVGQMNIPLSVRRTLVALAGSA